MRIAIDISPVVYGTGVSVYTKELVRNLLKIDNENEYVLFGGSLRRRTELQRFVDSLQGRTLQAKLFNMPPFLADVLWNRLRFPDIESFTGRVDVFHSSDWTQPRSRAFKVTTVHDLVPILHPEWSHPKIVSVHKRRLNIVKKEANAIIVPSTQTKVDLVDLGFDDQKIKVIYEAASSSIKRLSERKTKEVAKKFGIKGKYLLGVGVTPRKNTKRIVKAYERLKDEAGLPLVLVGHPVGLEIKDSKGIKVLGHVSDYDLSALYTGAEVLVYPSLYEGFGIPILDAMKCGTPVVTSKSGSMKEVAEDAAVLVDARSVDSIVSGVKKAMKSKKTIVTKGKKRAKEFSWQKMAKETQKVYKGVR